MNENILTPSAFTIGGRNYYLTSIFRLIDGDNSSDFFEFFISNDLYIKKILLWSTDNEKGKTFLWILFLEECYEFRNSKFLIHNLECSNKDFSYFLNFVRENTPQAIPYILFNYLG